MGKTEIGRRVGTRVGRSIRSRRSVLLGVAAACLGLTAPFCSADEYIFDNTVTVDGTSMDAGGNLVMGVSTSQNAHLNIIDGGTFTDAQALISINGQLDGSMNSVVVSGAGSQWITTTDNLYAGEYSGANITAQNGGTISVDGGLGTLQVGYDVSNSTGSITATLNIGNYDLTAPSTAGIINAASIAFASLYNSPNTNTTYAINFNQTDNITFTVPIVGPASIVPRGSGTTTIAAICSCYGPTTITSGSLIVGAGGALTSSAVTVQTGASLIVSDGGSIGAGCTIEPGALVTLSGATSSIGGTLTNVGTLNISNGAKYSGTGQIYGQLNVTSGGSVSGLTITTGGPTPVSSAYTGAAVVDGAGSIFSNGAVTFGGTLLVQNGGAITGSLLNIAGIGRGIEVESTGVVTVTGANSSATVNQLYVGGFVNEIGSGTLNILAGAKLTSTTQSSVSALFGDPYGPGSVVNLDGQGSSWTSAVDILLGHGGNATVNITGGASILAGLHAVNLAFGGPYSSATVNIGAYDLSAPTLGGTLQAASISLGSNTYDEDSNYIGGAAAINFNQTDTTTLSASIVGIGAVTQRGSGTTILTGSSSYTGSTTIDNGTLIIDQGGSITQPTVGIDVGLNSGDNGTLIVRAGSALSSASATVGSRSGTTGAATVTGAGSVWTIAGSIDVGGAGVQGTLNILNGGQLITGATSFIGFFGLGPGAATVDGAGSTWTTPLINVGGYGGNTSLSIQNGGNVVVSAGTGSVYLGSSTANPGVLNIGAYDLTHPTTAGTLTAASVVLGGSGIVNFNQTDTTTFAATISGYGNVVQRGTGTTLLTGTNSYTGTTTITAGKLAVEGSITGDVIVQAGELGGHGIIGGVISGSGTVGPGDSPGILTAGQTDPTGGLTYDFELTQPGQPDWGNAAASGNDVLNLTSATPFVAALNSNLVNIYFNSDSGTYDGGFFIDGPTDLLSANLTSANYNYYLLDPAGEFSYNDENYELILGGVTSQVVAVQDAAFGSGTTSGYTEQFTLSNVTVPEPASLGLITPALSLMLGRRRHRNSQPVC